MTGSEADLTRGTTPSGGLGRLDRIDRIDRLDRLDALRGLAVVWMAGFHFSFDLNLWGLWHPRQDFYHDPFWTVQRTLIVSLFMFCAGMGQAVAHEAGVGWGRFWRRWAQVAACALLVSAGSAWMFPHSWISFGVLHGMAVMWILLRLTARWRLPWVWVGTLLIVAPQVLQHPWFDSRWTSWVGLVTHKPITEDYVPVLPWLGVMGWGWALGQWGLKQAPGSRFDVLRGAVAPLGRPLAILGRWSLTFYMVHQPVILGVLMAGLHWGWWSGGTMSR